MWLMRVRGKNRKLLAYKILFIINIYLHNLIIFQQTKEALIQQS